MATLLACLFCGHSIVVEDEIPDHCRVCHQWAKWRAIGPGEFTVSDRAFLRAMKIRPDQEFHAKP